MLISAGKAPLPMEARSYMRTVEGMVYTSNKDSKLKACLLNGASASDIPDSAEFKHEFEEIAKNWKSLRGGSPLVVTKVTANRMWA